MRNVRGRALDHMPCSSDKATPTATPRSIGSASIAAAVATMSANSIGLALATATISFARMILSAMNSRTPLSAAVGT